MIYQSYIVTIGNRLWWTHQDHVGFGWLTKPTENPWSETTQKAPAC